MLARPVRVPALGREVVQLVHFDGKSELWQIQIQQREPFAGVHGLLGDELNLGVVKSVQDTTDRVDLMLLCLDLCSIRA